MYRYIRQVKVHTKQDTNLSKESVQDQEIKHDLFKILKDHSRQTTIMGPAAKRIEVFGIITLIILILSIIVSTASILITGKETPDIIGTVFVFLVFVGIGCFIGSTIASNIYIKRVYSNFSFLLRFSLFTFNKEALFVLQCDAVYKYIKSKGKMNKEQIDYLIAYYLEQSETLRKLRWLPIAIFSAFLFPLWNILLNKILKELNWSNWIAVSLVIVLILIPLVSFIVWIFRRNIEPVLFEKPNKYLQLAAILRALKSY